MITQEERRRAQEAGRILASPLFREALDTLRQRYISRWIVGLTTEQREKAWYLQNALTEVEEGLLEIIRSAALKEKNKDPELNGILKEAKK